MTVPLIEVHDDAGAGYGAIRRSLELVKTFPPTSPDDLKRALTEIKSRMDSLAESAPEVPAHLRRRIDRELKATHHHRIFELQPRDRVEETS